MGGKMSFWLVGILAAGLAGFLVFSLYGGGESAGRAERTVAKTESTEQPEWPEGRKLLRLAERALRDIGVRREVGFVEIGEEFEDGSVAVRVVLDNGRGVDGRMYYDRRRVKMSLDRDSLRDDSVIIIIERRERKRRER